MKKLTLLLLCILVMVSCSKPAEDKKKIIKIWSFSSEIGEMMTSYIELNPDVTIIYEVYPAGNNYYISKVNRALRKGIGAPDIFAAEISYLKSFLDKGYWENLSDEEYGGEKIVDNQINYAADLGRDNNGDLRALTWQATPGTLFYRRSLAKEYFGTDDPNEISKLTNNIDSYLGMAETIYNKSEGKVSLVASYQDIANTILNSRKQTWIVNNKIQMEKVTVDLIDQAYSLAKDGYVSNKTQWSGDWFSGMNDKSVFSYLLPTWGLNSLLKPRSPDGIGDWAMATPPSSYFWGGTWIGISKTSKNKELSWEVIEYLTSNKTHLLNLAKSGKFINNIEIIEELLPTNSESFLGGQNHFKYFYEEAKKINAENVGGSDDLITNAYWASLTLYFNGNIQRDQVEEQFKSTVRSIIPGVL